METVLGMAGLAVLFWITSRMAGPPRPTYSLPRKFRRDRRYRRR